MEYLYLSMGFIVLCNHLMFNQMADQVTISTQIDRDLKEFILEDAEDRGISISEWLTEAIHTYIDIITVTWDDLLGMDCDDLVDFVDIQDLKVNPDDCRDFWGTINEDELREAIADEMDIDIEDEEYEEEEEEE